jgi:hypothetical protein
MFAVIVESDRFFAELVAGRLKLLGVGDVQFVESVRTILNGEVVARRADFVVMERRLPWVESRLTEAQFKGWMESAPRRFPGLVPEDFNTNDSGERLVRWMRNNGMAMPIIFYTLDGQEFVSEDLRNDTKVYYCQKHSSTTDLDEVLKEVLTGL